MAYKKWTASESILKPDARFNSKPTAWPTRTRRLRTLRGKNRAHRRDAENAERKTQVSSPRSFFCLKLGWSWAGELRKTESLLDSSFNTKARRTTKCTKGRFS